MLVVSFRPCSALNVPLLFPASSKLWQRVPQLRVPEAPFFRRSTVTARARPLKTLQGANRPADACCTARLLQRPSVARAGGQNGGQGSKQTTCLVGSRRISLEDSARTKRSPSAWIYIMGISIRPRASLASQSRGARTRPARTTGFTSALRAPIRPSSS